MFNRTRKRLTVLFTGLMMMFLLVFIVITYTLLSSSIFQDQREAVIRLVHEERAEHGRDLLRGHVDKDKKEEDEHEHDYSDVQTFYYIVSKDGQLLDAEEGLPYVTSIVLEKLKRWHPDELEVHRETIIDQNGVEKKILFAAEPVLREGEYVGTVIAGTNVTAQQNVLDKLVLVLMSLVVLFLLLSLWLGYFMAGKAMVPISRSFQRQKEFVSDASHELRTPLAIMQSSLEVIEAEDQQHLSTFSQQIMQDMKEEVKRMTRLVSDLLTMARSDSGKSEFYPTVFDLKEVLEQLVRSFLPLANQMGISIEYSICSPISMTADKERITQLLYILIDNAIKYNQPGGKVFLTVRREGKDVDILVEDTGIGIPSDQLSRIFDRFYRVDKARSRELGSNGIGLSIAKWIVESHGGKIDVSSAVGKGTTFHLQIPIKE
ncbi:sensor histidine kinase [Bacillus sp. FJAT-42315]|uniref:sensor histidine kinase n=1 Tax=Bacillus sp. FJAT-42315 TaxID=2014077 RepID=UPI000C244BD4|nr:HAMP domain-containing sensor histidine kinase [Bacillus sp. FJAT-42315]